MQKENYINSKNIIFIHNPNVGGGTNKYVKNLKETHKNIFIVWKKKQIRFTNSL
jgi:hypothetical protein